ncbi:MAG: hypothetical protein KGQ41_00850 [Alphaproteobacteria bacterium]|nr:hypothetical protein [Alphaproteobacteria bacterium]
MSPFFKSINLYAALGLLFCLVLVLAPDLLPLAIGQDNSTWTPINTAQYRFGDNYYYAAWVAEVLQHGFPPNSPSAAEFADKPLLETLRWFPLFVAALPGFVWPDLDFRAIYIIDYVFTVCVFFGLPFYLTRRLTGHNLGALLVGISVLFFTAYSWTDIPVAVGYPGADSLWRWVKLLFGYVIHGQLELLQMFEYEALQGSFRYINLSISGPILMIYGLMCFCLYAREKPNWLLAAALMVLSPFMAFSYPSHALIAYLSIGGFSVLAFLRGRKPAAGILFGIGALTAAILFFGGYIGYTIHVFEVNALWQNIFHKETLKLIDRPIWMMVTMVILNKYSLTLALVWWLTRDNRDLRDMALVFGSIGCALAVTGLFDMPQLWGRFMGRGIDHLWFMTLLIAVVHGLKKVQPYKQLTQDRLVKLKHAFTVFVLAVPVLSFGPYAYHCATNGTRFMPEGRWQALQWIKENAADQTVATTNWDDLTFIPIYTPATLMHDHMIIGGRSPEDEVARYIGLWKFLGYPRDMLENRFKIMFPAVWERVTSKREKLLAPPLLDEEKYAASQIGEGSIYWSYVTTVNGMNVATPEREIDPAFLKHLMDLYDQTDAKAVPTRFPFKYVVVSGQERALPMKAALPLNKVYSNETHDIYEVTP